MYNSLSLIFPMKINVTFFCLLFVSEAHESYQGHQETSSLDTIERKTVCVLKIDLCKYISYLDFLT